MRLTQFNLVEEASACPKDWRSRRRSVLFTVRLQFMNKECKLEPNYHHQLYCLHCFNCFNFNGEVHNIE